MGMVHQILSLVLAAGLCVPAWAARDCCCRRTTDSPPACCAKLSAPPNRPKCCAAKKAAPVAAAKPVCQCAKDVPPVAVRANGGAKSVERGQPDGGLSVGPTHPMSSAVMTTYERPPRVPPDRTAPLLMLCRSLT